MNFKNNLLFLLCIALLYSCKKDVDLNEMELKNIGDTANSESYFSYVRKMKINHFDSVYFDPKYFGKGPFYTTYNLYFSIKNFQYNVKPYYTCAVINGKLYTTDKPLKDTAVLEVPFKPGIKHNIELYYQITKDNISKKYTYSITLPN